jgi:hypothetical protein
MSRSFTKINAKSKPFINQLFKTRTVAASFFDQLFAKCRANHKKEKHRTQKNVCPTRTGILPNMRVGPLCLSLG